MQTDGRQGLIIARGTGDFISVTCEAEPFENGDVVRFVVRKTPPSAQELLVKEVSTFTDGEALIQFSEADTLSFAEGNYVYGINIIRSGEDPQALIREASWIVKEAVARDEE